MTCSLRDQLAEFLSYEPSSGVFTWRKRKPRSPVKVGDVAGSATSHAYVAIHVCGRTYSAHRLAWLFVHGEWPAGEIDHRDGNRSHNAIANLRDVARPVNGQNQRRAQRNNATGMLGVTTLKGGRKRPLQAQINIGGRLRYLGVFETPELAHQAYLKAKRQHHEGCTI